MHAQIPPRKIYRQRILPCLNCAASKLAACFMESCFSTARENAARKRLVLSRTVMPMLGRHNRVGCSAILGESIAPLDHHETLGLGAT